MHVALKSFLGGRGMSQGRRILVVAQSTSVVSSLMAWLADPHTELVTANTFAAAKHHLATRPDLLIAEVKLGEYNGLHLALRGRTLGVPSIVLGAADETFSRQAEQLGALYLIANELDAERLRTAIRRVLEQPAPVEEPVQWYYGLVVRPIAVDASIALPELRSPGTHRGVVVH
jgi:DNA-binding NtrC family response regulator